MQFPKPSEADKDRFRALIPDAAGVEVRAMFGNLGAFVNGNMFAGLFGPAIGIKLLDEDSRDAFAALDGVGPFGPPERPLGGYLSLPPAWAAHPDLAAPWVERALEEVAALPAKAARPRPTRRPAAGHAVDRDPGDGS
jgi:TfoX/Sxy family transcriptional regulator of competence genes